MLSTWICFIAFSTYSVSLPISYERWDRIWQRFEEKGEAPSHDDLRELFPDEPPLISRTG